MKRVIILLLDSLGIGSTKDSEKFGDTGANTFINIYKYFENKDLPLLKIPNLKRLGIFNSAKLVNSDFISGNDIELIGSYGAAKEISFGKDTPSGHWEITGAPVLFDWGYFPKKIPCFPEELINKFINEANLAGILGNKHASGTEIIKELGDEHVLSKKPIIYTSADSVFQIAAHENAFGLEKLYKCCTIARRLLDSNIGRVIARPFLGESGNYFRTKNRKDYSVPPHEETLLNKIESFGGEVISVGKISDIFADSGITKKVAHSERNMGIFDNVINEVKIAKNNSLIFANFVDFDMLYGHRRDVEGYGKAIEEFDKRLPELFEILGDDDMVIITADHGCDPTFPGTDHTREYIPIMIYGKKINITSIGIRETFSDIGQTIADFFGIEKLKFGKSFLNKIIG